MIQMVVLNETPWYKKTYRDSSEIRWCRSNVEKQLSIRSEGAGDDRGFRHVSGHGKGMYKLSDDELIRLQRFFDAP